MLIRVKFTCKIYHLESALFKLIVRDNIFLSLSSLHIQSMCDSVYQKYLIYVGHALSLRQKIRSRIYISSIKSEIRISSRVYKF